MGSQAETGYAQVGRKYIIQAEDVFANPGPAAVNPVGRAEKTLLQASLEKKEHRDGGEPPPLSPTCRHRR